MKLKELLNIREPLKQLSEKHFINFKTVRAIADLIKAINVELEFFEIESNKLVKLYAELNDFGEPKVLPNGNLQLKTPEDKVAFNKEYDNLLNLDISDKIKTITISESDFKSAAELPTPLEMSALDCIIKWE